jgi:arsenate reductase
LTVKIYHNPRCSKSRQTLELVKEKVGEPEVILYLDTPPAAAELKQLLKMLGLAPRELMRRKEALYKELRLDDETLTDEALIKAMVAHPKLIERPIVVNGNKAALGRPPESVLDIL